MRNVADVLGGEMFSTNYSVYECLQLTYRYILYTISRLSIATCM